MNPKATASEGVRRTLGRNQVRVRVEHGRRGAEPAQRLPGERGWGLGVPAPEGLTSASPRATRGPGGARGPGGGAAVRAELKAGPAPPSVPVRPPACLPACLPPQSALQPGLPSRAAPRRAEWSRAAAAASRRPFKRSAGPWPGAAVVRPEPRSSPLFPPWFLSAPASNLAPGAPLARTPARRPGPRRLLQPPPSDGPRRAGRVASPPSAPAAES